MNKYTKTIILSSLLFIGCDDFKFGNSFLEKPLSDEMNIDSVYSKKSICRASISASLSFIT